MAKSNSSRLATRTVIHDMDDCVYVSLGAARTRPGDGLNAEHLIEWKLVRRTTTIVWARANAVNERGRRSNKLHEPGVRARLEPGSNFELYER